MKYFTLYSDSMVTLTSPYMRLIRRADNKIWDTDAVALAADTTYAHSAIEIAKDDDVVGWPIIIPPTLPAGEYDLLIYDNATPANTDLVVDRCRMRWNGSEMFGELELR